MVALQRYASAAYPQWRALLREAGMPGADALPADASAVQAGGPPAQLI